MRDVFEVAVDDNQSRRRNAEAVARMQAKIEKEKSRIYWNRFCSRLCAGAVGAGIALGVMCVSFGSWQGAFVAGMVAVIFAAGGKSFDD